MSRFADIDARRRRYNPAKDGYGSPQNWRGNFYERMGWEEASRVIHGQNQSPEEILGLASRSHAWSEIVTAYRKKAMECHPDRVTFSGMTVEAATEAFKRVSAAYSVLSRQYGK